MSLFPVHFRISAPIAQEGEGSLSIQGNGIQILPSMGSPFFIPFFQIDWLEVGEYSLTIGLLKEGKLELSQLGQKKEEAIRLIEENFHLACYKSLFLPFEDLRGIFPAEIVFGDLLRKGKLAVFPRLILFFFGMEEIRVLPIGFLNGISFNPLDYSLILQTIQGDIRLSMLGEKREKAENLIKKAREEFHLFVSNLIQKYLPNLDPFSRQKFTATILKEGAIKRSLLKEEKHWEQALSLIPEDKRDYAKIFLGLSNSENTFFGLSPSPPFQSELPYISWVSLRNGDILGFEVTSLEDFATYFFKVPGETEEEKENWVKEVHIFWPLVGFRREVLYKEESELKEEDFDSILLLSRVLPIFPQMRENLIKRVVHSDLPEWKKQVEEVFGGSEPGKS